jgi:hypothetical protein
MYNKGNTSKINNDRVCKAWVNFNGLNTVSIRGSYNVSSITDNATGDYTVNFNTDMNSAPDYSIVASSDTSSAGGGLSVGPVGWAMASTGVRLRVRKADGGTIDEDVISVQVFEN